MKPNPIERTFVDVVARRPTLAHNSAETTSILIDNSFSGEWQRALAAY